MFLDTGLNFELLEENTTFLKKQCKRIFYLEFVVGKEIIFDMIENDCQCFFQVLS